MIFRRKKHTGRRRCREFFTRHAAFGPSGWRTAAALLAGAMLLFWFGMLLTMPFPSGGRDWFQSLLFLTLTAAASFLLGSLIVTMLSRFQRIPQVYRWTVVSASFLIFNMLNPLFSQNINTILVIAYLTVFSTLLGAGIGRLMSRYGSRISSIVLTSLGAAGILTAVIWFIWPGPDESRSYVHPQGISEIPTDPSLPGPYAVGNLTYGSGTDRHRSEYGIDAQLVTPSVDISSMVQEGSSIAQWLRSTYWGFDLTSVPLNARVWYPKGEGPFPLVLIVHGNHSMFDFSDPGYEYLGRHLAGRGFITASVDQNFLNGGGLAEIVLGEITRENDARGYLLLEHLRLWHQWNSSAGHIFSSKVDTENIVLIGHSRGGEAAAIAALFNTLSSHPDNADIPFDYGYSIRGVAAFAPSDGQYMPRGQGTVLTDVSYLVIQGSSDSDVRSFAGSRQFDRAYFTGEVPGFKAGVYIDTANHGHFNTRWGLIDQPAASWLLNRHAVLDEEIQRRAAKIYISAFLESAVHQKKEYEQLFHHGSGIQQWIPELQVLTQYRNAETTVLADFTEDADLRTASLDGAETAGGGLTRWREETPSLGGWRDRDTVSVRLSWGEQDQGFWKLEFPGTLPVPEDASFVFDIAHAAESAEHLDFTLQLTDAEGNSAASAVSTIGMLPPSFTYRMFKPPLRVAFTSEPVFTTYVIGADVFSAENPALNLQEIVKISFLFDRTPAGDIYIDNVGLQHIIPY